MAHRINRLTAFALAGVILPASANALQAGDQGGRQDPVPTSSPSTPAASSPASSQPSDDNDFADLSLEELMDVQVATVSSVAGVSRPLLETPAAVTVLTAEDIRRAGHRSVAEALRMVPGFNVGRITSSKWAVASRGFNSEFTNKLLVMIDGRSVYSPMFSGVHWDVQNLVLEDIERIEVIRGPGATLWGANAVNGVVNIVTKSAKDTQGVLIEGGSGSPERGFSTLRYGMKLSENTHLRVYGQYFNRDGSLSFLDKRLPDDWAMGQGGFRMDWADQKEYSFTLQGDFYGSDQIGEIVNVPLFYPPYGKFAIDDRKVDGGNLLARLKRDVSADEGWSLQAYIDRTRRAQRLLDEERDIFDVDFRHRFRLGEHHKLLWGVGARHVHGESEGSRIIALKPPSRGDDTLSFFVQDSIALVPDRLTMMIGSKFEWNDFTGFEVQPGVRLSWTPDPRHTVWASVARAVRTPSVVEDDFDLTLAVVPTPGPTAVRLVGQRSVRSEELLAYEVGYRWQPTDRLSFDMTAFFNDYDEIIGLRPERGDPFTMVFDNTARVQSLGAELEAKWRVTDNWKLVGSYSFLDHNAIGGDAPFEGIDPEHQFQVRSMLDITEDLELNAALYYVDHRSAAQIPPFARFDLGVTWRPRPNVEVSLWGQNLIDDRHPEFKDPFTPGETFEVGRGVFVAIKFSF